MLPKAVKTCPKYNKSPNLVTLSAVEGQRPRNYVSCCWIIHLIYALSTSATLLPLHFSLSHFSLPSPPSPLPIYLPMSIYLCLLTYEYPTCIYRPTYINIPIYINTPTFVYLPMCVYLPIYVYPASSTYINIPTYLCLSTNKYQPMST